MRNNRIVNAYNSINPSVTDKQRMLDVILAEADLKEKPGKRRMKKEPVVYTGKATKESKRSIVTAIAASLVMLLIAGFAFAHMIGGRENDLFYAEPTEEIRNVTVNTSYIPVLDKYRAALREGWSKEQCEIEGISTRFYMPESVDFTIGKRMLDINNDGKAELLIGHDDIIWDLYTTLEDGTPIQLLSDVQDGWQYYLNADGLIAAEYFSKEDCYAEYYTLKGHQLEMELQLEYRDGQWKQQKAGQDWEAIIADSAEETMNSFEKFTPDWVPLMHDEDPSHYDAVIEKYRRAVEQAWPREMCIENGLSMLTPIESEYERLYYAIFDLDGNGVEELIISEYPYREDTDTSFIDIYTVLDGHVIQLMSLGDLDMRYLCGGGIVKDLTPPERGGYNAYVSFWEINQDGMLAQTGAVYEIDGQWYHGFPASEKITAAEAEAEAKALKPLYLDFTEIKSSSEAEYQSGYEAFDHIIQKYVTAINEGWTEHRCEQNDISPQILSDTCIQYNLGWCLVDIDSNGVEELVVSDGVHLFDLYVMMPHDGSPGHLVMANGGETWQLCENNVLQKHGLYSGTSAWRYYTLSDIDLIQRDMLFYEGETNQYSYGADDDSLSPIAKDKAGNYIAGNRTMELELTNFVDPAPFVPEEQKYYEPLLDIYRQAIRENWDAPTCMQNGLSLMVAHRGDYYEDLGYAMKDLDGNGIDELIITDGTNIYDLYTILQDEEVAPLHLVSAMERIQYYLTTDGWIYNLGSGGAAVSYHTLYSLEGRELKLLEGYMMDADTDPNNPWFYYDGQNRLGKCPTTEAAAAMDSYVFTEIPFTPFQ